MDEHRVIEVVAVSRDALREYALIPIAFTVDAVVEVTLQPNERGYLLAEHPIEAPYEKNYDDVAPTPTEWARSFDTSTWGFLVARLDGRSVGGVAVAWGGREPDMWEGRSDLAVLWDLRVAPEARRQGVGSALFASAEAWALAIGCRQLKVETQNVNVAACRFYAQNGCVLRAARTDAYPDCPGEVQLLWYKDLDHR